jgi:hypothetical protein
MHDPAVSVVIAIHEWPLHFLSTLDSVAQQTMPGVEVVVVVPANLFIDYVKDNLTKRKDTVRHYVADASASGGTLLRIGTAAARGRLITWMETDFVLDPRKIQLQAEALSESGRDFATCGIRPVAARDHVESAAVSLADDPVANLSALIDGRVNPSTVMATRTSLDAVGGFNADFRCEFALDVAVRLALRYRSTHISRNLMRSPSVRAEKPESHNEMRRIGEWLVDEAFAGRFVNSIEQLGSIVWSFPPLARPASAASAQLAKKVGGSDLAIGILESAGCDAKELGEQMRVPNARMVAVPDSATPLLALSHVLSASGADRIIIVGPNPTPSSEQFAEQLLYAAYNKLDACLPIQDPLIYESNSAASAIPGTLFLRSAFERVPLQLMRTEPQFWSVLCSAGRVGAMPRTQAIQRPSQGMSLGRPSGPPPLKMPEDLILALIDREWYLAMNPDVSAMKIDAADHFLGQGWRERRNPNPWFHTAWYLGKNPDVLARDINPLEHFVIEGAAAGCQPSPGFDITWYSHHYLDADQPCAEALLHFITIGLGMGAVPFPSLRRADKRARRRQLSYSPAASEPNDNDVLHALVDAEYYRSNYGPGQGVLFNAVDHYVEDGWRCGFNPNSWFDTRWYLSQNSEARERDANPLGHFIAEGGRRGRRPHPFFDLEWYADHYLNGVKPSAEALRHFLTIGLLAGAVPHPRIATPAIRKKLLETPPRDRSALIKRLQNLLAQVAAEGELPLSSDPDLWPLLLAEDLPQGVLAVLLVCGSGPQSIDRARAAAAVLPLQEYAVFGVAEDDHVLRLASGLDDGSVFLRVRLPEQSETLKTVLKKMSCHRAAVVDIRLVDIPLADMLRSIGLPMYENGRERRRGQSRRWSGYPTAVGRANK